MPRRTPPHAEGAPAAQEPKDLLGKKKWIGSQDVILFLQNAIDVDARTQVCNSGDDVASMGRELVRHFRTHGTPVHSIA